MCWSPRAIPKAQRVLEEAIRLSPLAVRRQALLGKLAMANEDFDTASRAYRQAVAQGRSRGSRIRKATLAWPMR
jgi:cytochrome c-type biogenesis protein CcmH/NrfG